MLEKNKWWLLFIKIFFCNKIYLKFQRFFAFFQFSLVNRSYHTQLYVISWIAARQASLSSTNSRSLLKLMSIESVMPSHHLIPCRPLLLLPSIFPSNSVFSSESVLHFRWPKYWSFSFSIILPMNIQDSFILGLTGWISLQYKGLSSLFQQHSSKASILWH